MGLEEPVDQLQGIPLVLSGVVILFQVARGDEVMLDARLFFGCRSGGTDGYGAEDLPAVTTDDRALVVFRDPKGDFGFADPGRT